MLSASVPILTWHAMAVNGEGRADNDHVAFREDLEWLHGAGFRILPLADIAAALREGRLDALGGCVGLSLDDGPDFDFLDVPHPTWGLQRGMAGLLADFRARHGGDAQPDLHATAFTIVSPEARASLDRTCMIGCRWWNDDWYRAAEASGLMAIESHGWDHNHVALEASATTAPRGTFAIQVAAEAEVEVGRAAETLRVLRARGGEVLFAYPYGDVSDFLADEWLPGNAQRFGISAAFGGAGGAVTRGTSQWRIPRYVHGAHWKSADDLASLLRDAGALARPRTSVAARARPEAGPDDWRARLRTWEVNDAAVVAGELFRRCFGHDIPAYPRHFVLVQSPEPGGEDPPRVVAYVHQTSRDDSYLCGGLCVDERAYRRFPKRLFEAVREQGGLATIVTRDSVDMLGECAAVFGHVGEPRARAADLRAGFVDTHREHLMAIWRRPMDDAEKRRRSDQIADLGPF